MDKQIDLNTDWLSDASLTPDQRRVWNLVRAELKDARNQIHELDTQIKTIQRQISEEDANRSVLTRPEFNREVARMLAFDERYGGVSSVLYFDFENLKDITKNLGNSVTNAAVRVVCDVLAKQIRNSDILGRLATNEFGVLLVRCDSENAWKKGASLASKLQQALTEVHGHKLAPVINYGAYTFKDSEDAAKGIKQAAESVTHA